MSPTAHERTRKVALYGVSLAALAAIGAWAYIVIGHSRYFDGYFANGAFQLFNPMRRVLDGQLPGRDFFVFHGVGTVWLHVPIYALFGQTLQAAETSRFATSALLHGIACIWLWAALRPHADWQSRTTLALLFFIASALALDRIFLPQNSLLGTRSVFPIYVALSLLMPSRWVVVALVAGGALLVSPEHGLASTAALAITGGLATVRPEIRRTAWGLMAATAAACGIYYLVMELSSSGYALQNIQYALRDVPTDQFWYFGVAPNPYLPRDLPHLFSWAFYLFAILWICGAGLTVAMWRAASPFKLAAVFLLVYATFGTVSQLGYLADGNLQGSERALMLIVVLGAVHFWQLRWAPAFPIAALVGIVLWTKVGGGIAHGAHGLAKNPNDGFLSAYWKKQAVAVDLLAGGGKIWSIYAGLPEAARGEFAPSFDYIIHALGPRNRHDYSAAFDAAKPVLVRLDQAHTWNYGRWLVSSNWDFFKRVFTRYELAYQDEMSTLWTPSMRGVAPVDESETVLPLAGECALVKQSTGELAAYTLTVHYSLENPWERVPLIGLTPRIVFRLPSQVRGEVSLPPPRSYGGTWEIPLVLQPNEEGRICGRVDTFLPGVRLVLAKVVATRVRATTSGTHYMARVLSQ